VIDVSDSKVLVRTHQRAVGRQSGVPVEADFWLLHTLRDGKTIELDIYADASQALEAAGLSE
jgi:ketosteroid isomerase-like protein